MEKRELIVAGTDAVAMSPARPQPTAPGKPPAGEKAPPRLEWLDALRGIAILGVFLVHSAYSFPSLGHFTYPLFLAGRYGVDLFFVISGFVLYHAFRSIERRSVRPRLTFLLRRWARLAPLYYSGIIIYGVIGWLAADQPPVSFGSVVWNLTFLNGWIPHQANSVVPGGWSISAEAAFAIVFVCILPWLRTLRSALIVSLATWLITRVSVGEVETLLTSVSNATRAPGMDSEYIPWQHLPTFMFGVCCWHVWNSGRSSDQLVSRFRQIVYTGTGMALVVSLAFQPRGGYDRCLQAGGGAAFLVLACAERGLPRRVCWLLSALGRISFGLYLFHFAFVGAARTAAVTLLPIGSPSLLFVVLTMLMTLAGAAPLAFLSWKYLERPAQDWAARRNAADSYTSPVPTAA